MVLINGFRSSTHSTRLWEQIKVTVQGVPLNKGVGHSLEAPGVGQIAGGQDFEPNQPMWMQQGMDDEIRSRLGEGPEIDAIYPKTNRQAGLNRQPRHHIFPQEHRKFFEERGVDIDQFTIKLDEATHQAIHGGGDWRMGRKWEGEWNRRIMTDIKRREKDLGRKMTSEELMETAKQLMHRYGIDEPFIPYKD